MSVCVRACVLACVYVCVRVHVCEYVCVCTCMRAYMYITLSEPLIHPHESRQVSTAWLSPFR